MTGTSNVQIDPHTGRVIEFGPAGLSFSRSLDGVELPGSGLSENDSDSPKLVADVGKDNSICSIETSERENYKERNGLFKRKLCLPLVNQSYKYSRIREEGSLDSSLFSGAVSVNPVVKKWENPVIGAPENASLNLKLENSVDPHIKKFLKVNSLFCFDKRNLSNFELLGQVDNKFIACVGTLRRRTYAEQHNKENDELTENSSEGYSKVLVLFDQHAVHERIRLERLQYQFLTGFDVTLHRKRPERPLTDIVPYSTLNPFLIMKKTDILIDIKELRDHLEDFKRIGIILTVMDNSVGCVTFTVKSLPRLFVKAKTRKSIEKVPILDEDTIFELIINHLNFVLNKSRFCPMVPPAVAKILNSLACHGAIRFGDSLSREDMEDMLKQLPHCDLPFQCAHGRPSVVPLFNITLLHDHI